MQETRSAPKGQRKGATKVQPRVSPRGRTVLAPSTKAQTDYLDHSDVAEDVRYGALCIRRLAAKWVADHPGGFDDVADAAKNAIAAARRLELLARALRVRHG